MNLRNKFLTLSKVELIEIAEIHSDYTIEAKNIANQILKEHHKDDFLEELKQYWINHIKENIKTILMNKKLPKSQFLDENAIKDLVKEDLMFGRKSKNFTELIPRNIGLYFSRLLPLVKLMW